MNRDEILAIYDPLRAAIVRVTSQAVKSLQKADCLRGAKHLEVRHGSTILLPGDDDAADMLCDLSLFEPDQRGVAPFNRFLKKKPSPLTDADAAIADKMGHAFFSLFLIEGRHEHAGIWLDDLLQPDRRIWLMDRALETNSTPGMIIGIRLFDAGLFHAGFGIAVQPDQETIQLCVAVQRSSGHHPFRHSLAGRLYADHLIGMSNEPATENDLIEIFAAIAAAGTGPPRRRISKSAPKKR